MLTNLINKAKLYNKKQSVKKPYKKNLLKKFANEDMNCIFITNRLSFNQLLTYLNGVKPIDISKNYYRKHIICRVEKPITQSNLQQTIEENLYKDTEHMFIDGIIWDRRGVEALKVKKLLKQIQIEKNIKISISKQWLKKENDNIEKQRF